MPPGNTLIEAHKSSRKKIWTNRVRLKGYGTGKCRYQTREEIDKKLIAAGWVIQDKKRLNLHESLGVAVREMINIMNIESKRALTPLIARKEIDDKLIAAGWVIQDKNRLNLNKSLGVAVRELINFMNIESKRAQSKRALTPLIVRSKKWTL